MSAAPAELSKRGAPSPSIEARLSAAATKSITRDDSGKFDAEANGYSKSQIRGQARVEEEIAQGT